MTEGEKKDDLFEDLDKFFAPIQDVDWPETTPPGRQGSTAQPDDTAEGSAPEGEPSEGEPSEGEGGVPTETAPLEFEEETVVELEESDVPSAEAGVEPPLFGELEGEEEIVIERFDTPPPEYVNLPGPRDEREGAGGEEIVAEETVVIEEPAEAEVAGEEATTEGATTEEAPSEEAVEAAAEHFAESVRDEVRVEPESAEAAEEATISDLLGEPEEGAPEEAPEPSGPVRTVKVGVEGLGGPSWQEPTAVEVGPEEERKPTGRDMPAAFLTGIGLAIVGIGSLAIADWLFAIVAGIIVLWAQGELYLALQKRGYQPATALGLVAGGLVLAGGYFHGEPAMLAMVVLSMFATFLWFMAVPGPHRKHTSLNIGLTVLGIVYIPLLAGYALAMLDLPDGRAITLAVIALAFVYDAAAFAVGYFWGSRPLASTISPKKSWEGAIGATLVVVAVSIGIIANTVDIFSSIGNAVALAVVVSVFAPIGDLAESLLKRDLGLKDMGSILPGHGGVLDRIDSVLFVVPAAFLLLRFILL